MKLKLKQVLDLLDHEVWVRVRPNGDDKRDVVFWSADWLMHAYLPEELDGYLEWDADDLSVEERANLENKDGGFVRMLVVCVYEPEPVQADAGPKEYITTGDLRALLKVHGQLWLGSDAIGKLARGEYGKEQPDIQWLYDCAMEMGNSEGAFDVDPLRLRFTNAGTCTLGIVCDVRFCNTSLPARVLAKHADGKPVWPEDMDGVEPSSVEISYDEFHDEEEDDE